MNRVFAVPGAIVFGVLGALVGSVVNGEDTGAEAGVQAGAEIGSSTALGIDEAGGAFKWVPGKVFVTMVRLDLEATRR